MNLLKLLSNRDYGLYNKTLAKEIGLHESILLSELCAEHDYWETRGELVNGWFFSTADNIYQNTSLSAYQQRGAFNKLEELGVIETAFKGVPAKKYFRLRVEGIESLLDRYFKPSRQETKDLDVEELDSNNINNKNNNKINTYPSDKATSETSTTCLEEKEENVIAEPAAEKPARTYSENSRRYNAIKQYIDSLSYSTDTKTSLFNWYNSIGVGKVSVKQLRDKLKKICDETHGNESAIKAAIDASYLNGWYGFFVTNNRKNTIESNTNTGFNRFNEPITTNKPADNDKPVEKPRLSSKVF